MQERNGIPQVTDFSTAELLDELKSRSDWKGFLFHFDNPFDEESPSTYHFSEMSLLQLRQLLDYFWKNGIGV